LHDACDLQFADAGEEKRAHDKGRKILSLQDCRRQDGIKCVKHEIHVHELHPSEDLCHQTLVFKPSQLPAHSWSAQRPTMQRHQDAFPAEIEKDRA